MTQPPFDPFDQPMRPVHLPQAGPPQGSPYGPPQGSPYGPQPLGFPGQMRGIDQQTSAVARPGAVVAAFVLWLLAALIWPVGTVVRELAEQGGFVGFGAVMTLFATGCLAVGGVWGAVAFLGGSYYARIALCGGYLVLGILAVAAAVVASRSGGTEAASWAVIVLRLVLPAAAGVLSFLPGTRHYFAGNLG
ncbi:proline-rich domain-containing protein [Actinosynnema sp. NPDC047251]|uniref:Putative membrane protein n=1 Tax=Saccharothrix espanaensis (strain ATCC 51144 / DSM 44229 / JCM 9112 / NBRC 15066 / NRRL 15764) TaxID=1179773 RepID=K0KFJ5_SACES|nr:proline-rich domain-containing protein [Saccharothrix espanaensis]CCH35293.1 putative membrane protein [Saccharothrix espanaensis DSM 44229]